MNKAGFYDTATARRGDFMKDRDFLIWMHERLEHVHGESGLVDYMHKLRDIIKVTPPEQETTWGGGNSLEELKKSLEQQPEQAQS